ncbi:hypothetical protein TNCV_5043831 [Trichonephila clavipes]|uniref:Uncharacterized protein n=1 Tax=Trichonephila clavipes TaxID=2585209 RepID=A0A8X6WI81_TRICX|nr:hypothetical protein TNCV_5043831 [Trichonephila clavipes]
MSAADMFLAVKTDSRPYITLGGGFNLLKHFKDAQQILYDCYRAGNGASVFAKDAGQQGCSYRRINDTGPTSYRGPNMCNYSPTHRAPISKKRPEAILI